MNKVDITGQKFGRLTALHRLHNYHKKGTYWLCVCECGNLKECFIGNLRSGAIKSCGCLHDEGNNKKHGQCGTRLYRIWKSIKQRCHKNYNKNYKNYGGRGIVVCDEWCNNFQLFYGWAMANGYNDNLTIDRIDVNGNYEPSNCRWATMKQQNNNRRDNKYITIDNVTKTLTEWCEFYNLNYKMVCARLYKGQSIEQALEME